MSRAYNKLEVLEITELTAEQMRQIANDRMECHTCEYCTMAYLSYKGEDLEGSCSRAEKKLIQGFVDFMEKVENKPIEQPAPPEEAPKVEENTVIKPFYQQTVDFMQRSGYTHCYMCGSELR